VNIYLKYILEGTVGYFGVILYVTITKKLKLDTQLMIDFLFAYIFLIFLCFIFAWIEVKWVERKCMEEAIEKLKEIKNIVLKLEKYCKREGNA